jgi:hypothetical protein
MQASKYVIKGIVCNEASASGNVVIEFPDLANQGGGHRWSKNQDWMRKWVVSRGAFPLGKERLDEECLKEWYHSPSESTAASSGEDEVSEYSDDSGKPRGVPDPKSLEVLRKVSDADAVVSATIPAAAGAPAKGSRKRRGPAKGQSKGKGMKTGGKPRGVPKSQIYDSDSSDPRIPTSGEDEDQAVPASQVPPGDWLEGPGDPPDELVHTGRPGFRKTLEQWEGLTDTAVFMKLAGPMLKWILECTNDHLEEVEPGEEPITTEEFMSFIGFKIFTGIVHLSNVKSYYYYADLAKFGVALPNFALRLPYNTYLRIVKYLRFEKYADKPTEPDNAWKVRTITQLAVKAFRETNEQPSRELTLDEGMGKCEAVRNPIFQHVSNKPVDEGFKWYMLVDAKTKLVCNFVLADGNGWPGEEVTNFPGKTIGRTVWELIQPYAGHGHVVYMDNYFTDAGLARFLRGHNTGTVGTMRKDRVAPEIRFPGKHPKPSRANPKGTLKFVHTRDDVVQEYAWMDTAACYFIDTVYGGKDKVIVERKSKELRGEKVPFEVPKAIKEYNEYMGGADTNNFHSMGFYSLERNRRCTKWTVRYMECLLSRLMAQAFIIGNVVNHATRSRSEFQQQLFSDLFFGTLFATETRRNRDAPGRPDVEHVLVQTPVGSRNTNDPTCCRRYRGLCVMCPHRCEGQRKGFKNGGRGTHWYCSGCLVPLHPACSADYHVRLHTATKIHQPRQVYKDFLRDDRRDSVSKVGP